MSKLKVKGEKIMNIRKLIQWGWDCTILHTPTDDVRLNSLIEWGLITLPDGLVPDSTKILNEIDSKLASVKALEGYMVYKMQEYFKSKYDASCYYGARNFYEIWKTRYEKSGLTASDKYNMKKYKIFNSSYWNETKFAMITDDTELKTLPMNEKEIDAVIFFLEIDDLENADYTIGDLKHEVKIKKIQLGEQSVNSKIDNLVYLIGNKSLYDITWRQKLLLAIIGKISKEYAIATVEQSEYFNFIIDTMLDSLTEREINILRFRFKEGLTLRQIAGRYDVNGERIREIEAKALRKLRSLVRSKGIARFMETYDQPYLGTIKSYIFNRDSRASIIIDTIVKHDIFAGIGLIRDSEAVRTLIEIGNPYVWAKNVKYSPPVAEDNILKVTDDLSELYLSVHTYGALSRCNCKTIGDVIALINDLKLPKVKGIGKKSIEEIFEVLDNNGFTYLIDGVRNQYM